MLYFLSVVVEVLIFVKDAPRKRISPSLQAHYLAAYQSIKQRRSTLYA
jgi:hypothetical protein